MQSAAPSPSLLLVPVQPGWHGRGPGSHVQRLISPGRLATLGLLVVLFATPGLAFWGAFATYRAGEELEVATTANTAAQAARYAVAAQESLERKYRLDPGEAVRTKHREAADALMTSLTRVAVLKPSEIGHVSSIVDRHKVYIAAIDHMFAAVDAGDIAAATEIDNTELDPAFDVIEEDVFALAEQYRSQAASALGALSAVQRRVLFATPLVFVISAALLLFFWRVLRAAQHEARAGLLREANATKASERRFRGLVQNASDTILICSGPGSISYQSPGAEMSWGHADRSLLETQLAALCAAEDQPTLAAMWEQLLSLPANGSASRSTEVRLRVGGGEFRHAHLIATNSLDDPAIAGVVVTIRDITERKAFEEQLTRQAFYDPLTNLPNRVLFRDRLEQALVRAGRRRDAVGLLFIDLDNFKLVNDSLGHHVGDKLLIEAADRLRGCVRAQDTVARLGGDEFVVVLDLLNGEVDALPVAKAIAEQFSHPFVLDGRSVVVTASIGVAISDAGRQHTESLLRDADVAMYRAKSDGRARFVVFEPSMHRDTLARLELENDLRRALENKELRVFYQPIVQLGTARLREVEALVRWQHPTRGLVSPGDFIPMAEETGLIIPLGQWVLEQACHQAASWQRSFPHEQPVMLSVNLSPRQFGHPDLVADVTATLRDAGLAPGSLKLEITEGVIMHDAEASIRTLWELKALGVQLAIDDFGTGYSSLSYLKRLPLDVLKIDRSFVSGLGNSQEDAAIVHAIMALAKSLNLKVTGEGIETPEQAALLGEWGCDWGQGYLFGRPVDGSATSALMREMFAERPTELVDS